MILQKYIIYVKEQYLLQFSQGNVEHCFIICQTAVLVIKTIAATLKVFPRDERYERAIPKSTPEQKAQAKQQVRDERKLQALLLAAAHTKHVLEVCVSSFFSASVSYF